MLWCVVLHFMCRTYLAWLFPYFPFLTAMQTPSEIVPMLKEIALYGTTMAVVITGVWFGMTLVAERLAGKRDTEERAEQEG